MPSMADDEDDARAEDRCVSPQAFGAHVYDESAEQQDAEPEREGVEDLHAWSPRRTGERSATTRRRKWTTPVTTAHPPIATSPPKGEPRSVATRSIAT